MTYQHQMKTFLYNIIRIEREKQINLITMHSNAILYHVSYFPKPAHHLLARHLGTINNFNSPKSITCSSPMAFEIYAFSLL